MSNPKKVQDVGRRVQTEANDADEFVDWLKLKDGQDVS